MDKVTEYGAVALVAVVVRELCAVCMAAIRGWSERERDGHSDQVNQAIIRTAQHTEALTRLLEGLVRDSLENAKALARIELRLERPLQNGATRPKL